MSKKDPQIQAGRRDRNGILREQALCMAALESGEYDSLSDNEWVELCERTANDSADDQDHDHHRETVSRAISERGA